MPLSRTNQLRVSYLKKLIVIFEGQRSGTFHSNSGVLIKGNSCILGPFFLILWTFIFMRKSSTHLHTISSQLPQRGISSEIPFIQTFSIFRNIKPLVEFNIYGSITNEGIEFLRSYLQPTLVNTSPLSDIARPSIHAFQRRVI